MLITDGKNILKSEYRHPDMPRINAPLNVRSCGHYITYKGWHEPPKVTKFFELFWGISGKGEFIFQEKKFILDALQKEKITKGAGYVCVETVFRGKN